MTSESNAIPESAPNATVAGSRSIAIGGSLRLAIAQLRSQKGDVAANLKRARTELASWEGRADVVVFPETFLSGYFVEGGVEEVARTPSEIADGLGPPPTNAPDLVLGAYERDGGVIYNAALHFTPRDGRWTLVHRHRKTFLPTYGVFDEARFVATGDRVSSYDTRFGRMGLLICEEMLHSLPPAILALQGAPLMVCLAASPARDFGRDRTRPGNLERWELAGRAITLEHGCYLAVAQTVGSEGGKLFPGGSAVYGPGGSVDGRATLFREHRLEATVDGPRLERHRVRSPLLSDLREALPRFLPDLGRLSTGRIPGSETIGGEGSESSPGHSASTAKGSPEDPLTDDRARSTPNIDRSDEGARRSGPGSLDLNLPLVEEALCAFLEDEVRLRRGFERVVVGVSGGVDSAVTLALAVRAFGADAVHAVLLPYATSSSESLTHGKLICEELGVTPRVVPISEGIDAYIRTEESDITPLRRGNLAARFRALVLWDQSARLDALVLGTGNKSERLLGYYTWHADDSPPINPLGDLFKTQVRAIAGHLGVPEEIIRKPPSADLVEGVHDEHELGISYDDADPILNGLLEGFTPAQLGEVGFDHDAVDLVYRTLHGTHWKRRPPTVAMISSTAIGEFYLRPVDY